MKDFAKKYLDKYNSFSKVVKILLCLLYDIPSALYRLSKSALKDNTLGIILAIILCIFGGWILFVIDIVTLALKDQILWLDDLGVDEKKMAASLNTDESAKEKTSAKKAAEDDAPAVDGEVDD